MSWFMGVPSPLWVTFAAALGAVAGSFINAAVYRLPRGISLVTRTRSFCPMCEAQLRWYDNIPIFSFLWLGGRCRACRKPIPARYLTVELLAAALFALSAYQFFILNAPPAPGAALRMPWVLMAAQMFLVGTLLCVAFTDLETWYIPIQATWPATVLGVLLAPLFPELHLDPTPWLPAQALGAARWNALIDSLQGLIVGAGLPWVIGFVCIVLLRKEGMGSGDSHLLGMIGSLLGWKPALAVFFLGILIGCALGLATLAWDRIRQARLGDQWQPRRPTFELTEEELTGPPPAWPLLVLSLLVLSFEGVLFWLYSRHPGLSEEGPAPVSAVLGVLIGAFMLLAYPVRRHLVAAGDWPHGELRVREDGKTEEVLHGNYIPFGPSLSLAGLLVAFYDPLIRALAEWWLYRPPRLPALPFRVPFF
jgi:leader peptidase (prepilin peptidase)/N-methyltransferase